MEISWPLIESLLFYEISLQKDFPEATDHKIPQLKSHTWWKLKEMAGVSLFRFCKMLPRSSSWLPCLPLSCSTTQLAKYLTTWILNYLTTWILDCREVYWSSSIGQLLDQLNTWPLEWTLNYLNVLKYLTGWKCTATPLALSAVCSRSQQLCHANFKNLWSIHTQTLIF